MLLYKNVTSNGYVKNVFSGHDFIRDRNKMCRDISDNFNLFEGSWYIKKYHPI